MTEQLSSNEHIDLTPELSSLVSEFGLDFAMAFTILRPRINAELEKAATEEKAALQKRLQAEKDSLTQKIMSPVQAASPILPPSPTTAASVFSMMEGDDGDVAMEDIKVEGANGEVSSVPAPRIAKVFHCPGAREWVADGARTGLRYTSPRHCSAPWSRRKVFCRPM